MRTELGPLYVAHADRLYSYCWSLVGEQLAPTAVGSTFNVAVRQQLRVDNVLWMYSLSRAVCTELGAFSGAFDEGGLGFPDDDPLLRAASELRTHYREVLLLSAGEWLDDQDIARFLGLAPDTVAQLITAARMRLERSILDILIREDMAPQSDVISAFERNRLPNLLARRAPARAPEWLRDQVSASCAREAALPIPGVLRSASFGTVGPNGAKDHTKGPLRIGVRAGVVASAAFIGVLACWPAAKQAGVDSLIPTAIKDRIRPDPEHSMGTMPKASQEERGAENTAPPKVPAPAREPLPREPSKAPTGHPEPSVSPPDQSEGPLVPEHPIVPPVQGAPVVPPVARPPISPPVKKAPTPPPGLPESQITPPGLPENQNTPPGLPESQNTLPGLPQNQRPSDPPESHAAPPCTEMTDPFAQRHQLQYPATSGRGVEAQATSPQRELDGWSTRWQQILGR